MYNFDMICTYKLMDNDEDKQLMYQVQLLQLFNLQKYDSELLIDNINKLYDTFKENKNIIEIINNNPYKNQLMNDFLVFQTYFSFNTLDVFHKCLQDIKNKNSISENNKEELLKLF